MSFAVQLAGDQFQVDPGSTVTVPIEVANRTDAADQFEVSVEGLDPTWVAIPVPSFTVDAREVHVERVFLKPPRDSESLAGTYPFVIRIRSLESGEARTVQGVAEVRPFTHFTVDLQPRKGTLSPLRPEETFQVTVMNLGNEEQTLNLFASDAEDLVAFELDHEQCTVSPGQQKTLTLAATAKRKPLLANSRLAGFSVTSRSIQNPAAAATAQGQVEQRALMSPGTFLFISLGLVLLLLWFLTRPKPPGIDSLTINPREGLVAQPVTIQWSSSNATSVRLRVGNETLDKQPADGSFVYTPTVAGEVPVSVIAVSGEQSSTATQQLLVIREPAPVPDPKIVAFDVTPATVPLGQSYKVEYRFNDAVTEATLTPAGLNLDLTAGEVEVQATRPGRIDITLIARNAQGAEVRETKSITVTQVSQAAVRSLTAEPMELESTGGRVIVQWDALNALRAEISYDGKTESIEPTRGSREFTITKDTTFKVTVYDSQDVAASKSITVKVAPPPPDEPVPPTTTGGGSPTTGATGGP